MANRIKSAVRRHRQNLVARERRRRHLSNLRTQLKALRTVIAENKADRAKELLTPAISLIDHGVTRGILHRNAAARTKSRLAKQVNAIPA